MEELTIYKIKYLHFFEHWLAGEDEALEELNKIDYNNDLLYDTTYSKINLCGKMPF